MVLSRDVLSITGAVHRSAFSGQAGGRQDRFQNTGILVNPHTKFDNGVAYFNVNPLIYPLFVDDL